jgi:hypothetical protein
VSQCNAKNAAKANAAVAKMISINPAQNVDNQ